jgi:small subunit ribosomal protein S20
LEGDEIMANVKCAKKAIKTISRKTKENQQLKSTVKNAIKNTDKAIIAGDKEAADKYLKATIKALDNAKSKGLVHKNKVDREKSRLAKKVNNMEVK